VKRRRFSDKLASAVARPGGLVSQPSRHVVHSVRAPIGISKDGLRARSTPLKEGVSKEAIAHALAEGLKKAFRTDATGGNETADRSLAKALTVLKDMKGAGKTWQEMGDRMEKDFGTRLDKDQLKALVR